MKIVNLILLLFLVIPFTSCKKTNIGDCFNSTGELIEQERDFSSFKKIILKDNVNLILIPGGSNILTVTAGKNIIDKITTEEFGDSLIISNTNTCDWVRSYKTTITVNLPISNLQEIEYRSIGDITCLDTVFCDSLILNVNEGAGKINLLTKSNLIRCSLHYGTADIIMSGKCDLSYVYSAGFGLIDNRALVCKQTYVNNKSSNDVFLNATVTLGATIENIGNIYYLGKPGNISINQLGTGQLIELSE